MALSKKKQKVLDSVLLRLENETGITLVQIREKHWAFQFISEITNESTICVNPRIIITNNSINQYCGNTYIQELYDLTGSYNEELNEQVYRDGLYSCAIHSRRDEEWMIICNKKLEIANSYLPNILSDYDTKTGVWGEYTIKIDGYGLTIMMPTSIARQKGIDDNDGYRNSGDRSLGELVILYLYFGGIKESYDITNKIVKMDIPKNNFCRNYSDKVRTEIRKMDKIAEQLISELEEQFEFWGLSKSVTQIYKTANDIKHTIYDSQ